MDISFINNKLQKIFESEKELIRNYGEQRGKKIKRLVSFLRATTCLEHVPITKPYRRQRGWGVGFKKYNKNKNNRSGGLSW